MKRHIAISALLFAVCIPAMAQNSNVISCPYPDPMPDNPSFIFPLRFKIDDGRSVAMWEQGKEGGWEWYKIPGKWRSGVFYSKKASRRMVEQLLVDPDTIKYDTQFKNKMKEATPWAPTKNKSFIFHELFVIDRTAKSMRYRSSAYQNGKERPIKTFSVSCTER